MAKSGRAKGGDNASTTTPNLLVERQSADASDKPAAGALPSRNAGDTDDRSFANIHTGDRAVHQSVQMTPPAGAPPAQADAAATLSARSSTGSAPGYDAATSHAEDSRGPASAAEARGASTAADATLPFGSGSAVARVASHADEFNQHAAGADAAGLRGAPASDSASPHAGGGGGGSGGGGGGGAGHGQRDHGTDISAPHTPTLTISAAVGAGDLAVPLDIT